MTDVYCSVYAAFKNKTIKKNIQNRINDKEAV